MTTYEAILYQASSPVSEYTGSAVVAFAQNLRADLIRPVLVQHGLENIDPFAFYPQQPILNVLHDIEQRFTFEELVAVGMKLAELIPLPPELGSIEALLLASDVLYKSTCRTIPANEGVTVQQIGRTQFRMTYNVPSPPYLIYGILFGMLRRVQQSGQDPRLKLIKLETPFVIEVKW